MNRGPLSRAVSRVGRAFLSLAGGVAVLNGLFATPGQQALEGRLGALIAQRAVISDAIANVDTPGYSAVGNGTFAAQMQQSVDAQLGVSPGSSAAQVDGTGTEEAVQLAAQAGSTGAVTPDGNSVDLDAAMVDLSKSDLYYQAVTQQLQLTYQNMQTAISAGGA